MDKQKVERELWRLRVNGILTLILAPMLYLISQTAYLSSYHRFVTNPKEDTAVKKEEPGLGESEVFYSLLSTTLNFGSVIGGLLSGALVKCVPHWYQFLFAISLHVLGYTLYGVSYHGWILLISMGLAGYFVGAEVTLCFNYATEMSIQYMDLLRQKGENIECEKENFKTVRIRNYLYSAITIGNSVGFVCGTGIAVLFSHLPIEQYRSIAWFNVACGVLVLFLFTFFFRGERSWSRRNVKHCRQICQCVKQKSTSMPGLLPIFIIVTMHLLTLIHMMRWSYFDTLLNPILSDSFGLSMKLSSYFYIGFAIPRTLGSLLQVFLQRIKVSIQIILVIGISMAVTGYILVADWSTIPYDPCTEFSPFHHSNRYQNQTLLEQHFNYTHNHFWSTSHQLSSLSASLVLHSDIEMKFENGKVLDVQLPIESSFDCQIDNTCPVCKDSKDFRRPCLSLVDLNGEGTPVDVSAKKKLLLSPQLYSCSLNSASFELLQPNIKICVTIFSSNTDVPNSLKAILESSMTTADIQSQLVLSDDIYAVASNACINANVSNGQCHWIPFSTVSREKCIDCPPICRNKQQTLLFPLFIIGMAFLLMSRALIWVPTIAITTNQSPKSIQGIMIGSLNTVNAIAECIGPVLSDILYERIQKRTFLLSILLAGLHIPFLVEIALLYQQLGPTLYQTNHEQKYTQLIDKEQTTCEDYIGN